jgi:hypothetical protein
MNAPRNVVPTTPRLLVVGLIVLGIACHRQQQPAPSVPPPSTTTQPKPLPAPRPATPAITGGTSLLQAMHDRYAGKWYQTLTFVQKTTISLQSGSEIKQTWHEAMQLPGKLRIDTDLAAHNGTLYSGDSVFAVTAGKLVRADTGRNVLLILGFDVYAQSAAKTMAQLRRDGFDLSKFHEGVWRGKPVYIVGAIWGDTISKQFWVEKERLLFVRLIQRSPQGRSDIHFDDYIPAGGGWIAVEVTQYVNGKRRLLEEYKDVKVDVPLSPALFDPRQWATAPHWAR